jgi:regulatory protein
MLRGRRARKSATRASAPASDAGGAAPARSPKSIAIRLLARREYGRAELATLLRARGIDPDAIERTLDELAALGYLSDARYAEAVVAGRSGRFSRRAIAHALAEKRVTRDAAEAALAPLAGRDEQADARALWERRFGTVPRDEREKARQVRFLIARGYSMSVALRVLKAAGTAGPDDDAL